MAAIDEISVLQKFAFFQAFRDDQLKLLAFGIEQVNLKEGDFLFYEDDQANSAFVLVSGKIELSAIHDGVDKVMAQIGPDTLIGETALIAKTVRKNTAHAISDCMLIKITHSAFRRLLDEFPETAPILYNYLSRNVNRLRNKVSNLPDDVSQD